jgi:fructoselysine-6-P-deglycase FrlB-like protein
VNKRDAGQPRGRARAIAGNARRGAVEFENVALVLQGGADMAPESYGEMPLDPAWAAAEQSTFLGRGWTVGLAHEAALKFRETSSSWAESYPAMDYRHGPISVAAPDRTVWMFGEPPAGLAEDVAATGATWVSDDRDPLVQLITAQRVAVAQALALGLNPDTPRNLTRSVVLTR